MMSYLVKTKEYTFATLNNYIIDFTIPYTIKSFLFKITSRIVV